MSGSRLHPQRLRAGLARRLQRTPVVLYITALRLALLARAELVGIRRYRVIDEEELRRRRTSDTVFVFGSGYSINDLTTDECSHFEQHNTFGFNFFFHQSELRMDFHLVREMSETDLNRRAAREQVGDYCRRVAQNPRYADTILLVQRGLTATGANLALASGMFPHRNPIYRWRSLDSRRELSTSLAQGLAHRGGALSECVNLAVLLGWTRIVLVGVDLYDRRYFWLGPQETGSHDLRRGASWSEQHRTARTGGIIDLLGDWADELKPRGIEVLAYNPRSLLTERLDIYEHPPVEAKL